MNKRLALSAISTLALTLVAVTHANRIGAQTQTITREQCLAQGKKITICHATSSETNPYESETISCNAIYGQNGNAGHFDENGTPQAGHEDDVFADENGLCPGETLPTPSVTPSIEPTPTIIIEATEEPTPSLQPTVSPTPTGSPDPGRETSMGYDGDLNKCESKTFNVTMVVKDHGNPVENILVTFIYNSTTLQARTNKDGQATVTFEKAGNGTLTAHTEGYASQSLSITMPFDCQNILLDPDKHSGKVLGASTTQGQVLGASTLADTGSSQDYLSYAMISTGLFLTLGSVIINAKNRQSI
jgi:hypothetical protein